MSRAATKTLVMNFCGLVPISLYVLSACAHAWLLVEVNPSRDTCTAIAYETIAVLVINVLLLAGGAFHGCAARGGDIAQTLKPFMPIGLAALAAVLLCGYGKAPDNDSPHEVIIRIGDEEVPFFISTDSRWAIECG